uniref:Uncharacterized protein n=1 Tax=Monodon monoceros TaxID=40151 RepID=A0A8C6FAS7_MONMO
MVDTAPNGPQEAGAVQFITANKLATAMLLSRLFIVYCSLFCLFLGCMKCLDAKGSNSLPLLRPLG